MSKLKWFYFLIFSLGFLFVNLKVGKFPDSLSDLPTRDVLQTDTQYQEVEKEIKSSTVNDAYLVKVVKVIDGDTVKIETGEMVRLIGIDAPETVHPSKSVACFGKEASAKAKELLEGNFVRLEKDVSEKDKYGRLLRYVWKGDLLINEFLVREGYAVVSTYPPDVKYQERFLEAQKEAREENKGLWLACSADVGSKKVKFTKDKRDYSVAGAYVCDCSKTCSQISSCEEAQYQLNVCNCAARDADGDGVACDSMCQ